jgi:UDP-N-acetylmuramoylalanine--D-glutamate ligase
MPRGAVHFEAALIEAMELKGKNVLVLGLGESGLACARWCARQGASVHVADTRETPPQLAMLKADVPAAVFTHTRLADISIDGTHAVVRSPGLAPHDLSAIEQQCEQRGIAWLAELDLFVAGLKQLKAERGYRPKLVAITGTNGKTTVTRLCGVLAERAGVKVAVAGNVSPAMLDELSTRIDANELPELWVLELSSFQLHGVQDFSPTTATVLNVTQDHLDWHGSMELYAQDKARVYAAAALCVINRDDAYSGKLAPDQATVLSFGLNTPQQVGDFGIETVGGMDWLVRATDAEGNTQTQPVPKRRKAGQAVELVMQRLMPAGALRISGMHNAANALAALALLAGCGYSVARMLHGLREYRGEPHRVEWVAQIAGVDYFDDSKGTNVGATVAALSGLQRKVVLIAGGQGKGQDFAPLAAPAAAHARAVMLIGEDATKIEQALQPSGVAVHHCASLGDAVQQAAALAQAGDAVLLSPACASFDMFRGYAHRAEVFVNAVRALQCNASEGAVL